MVSLTSDKRQGATGLLAGVFGFVVVGVTLAAAVVERHATAL